MDTDPILQTGDVSPLLGDSAADSRVLSLAAAMASAAYGLELEPFLATGWQDACAQLGPKVADGLNLSGGGSSLEALRQARKRLEQRRQLGRSLTAGLREWRSGGGVKALVMLRRWADGRFLVAVSFMGSVQLDDWMANFDMMNQDGLHRGFHRRALAFEEAEEEINFPQAAEQLGLERLTLRMVMEACARPDSPFRIFLTGHSLGAAVMQLYVHRLLTERGVCRELVQGVGFASPTVASADALKDPSDWPLCHVINSDDCVPRLGAEVHLGLCLRYPADRALREACYGLPWDEASVRARTLALPVYTMMQDSASALAVVCGILRVIMEADLRDILPALGRLGADWPGLQRVIEAGDSQADRMIRFILRRAEAACRSISGHGVDGILAERAAGLFREAARELGAQQALNTMTQIGAAVHGIRSPEQGTAPYAWIAAQPLERFEPFVWEAGRPPRRRTGRWPE